MSATVVCRRQKVLKLRRLKRLKNSPKKRNLEQKRSYSRFYNRKSQRQQKLAKKITYLIIPFRSKNLIYFTDLNSPNMFLVDFRKKVYIVSFLDAQELHSRNTGKANVCIFLYISIKSFDLVLG